VVGMLVQGVHVAPPPPPQQHDPHPPHDDHAIQVNIPR
jgi:hypothetical protein